MAMVGIDNSSLQVDLLLMSVGLVCGLAAAWRCSTFIKVGELLQWFYESMMIAPYTLNINQSTLQWWATRFLPPLAEVISDLQHAAIWRYLDHERRLTDKEVLPSLARHCGTRCRSLFVTHLWQCRSSADIWRLFCFAEHIVLSIALSWQFRL